MRFSWSIPGSLPAVFFLSSLSSLSLLACDSESSAPEPTIRGYFGNRLEGLPPRALFDSSLKALGLMRDLSGDSYAYRRNGFSFLSVSERRWTVTVRSGVPERMEYERVEADGGTVRKVETASDWALPGDAESTLPSAPVTLDSLYAQCRDILDRCAASSFPGFGPAEPRFRIDSDYILSACDCANDGRADHVCDICLDGVEWARR